MCPSLQIRRSSCFSSSYDVRKKDTFLRAFSPMCARMCPSLQIRRSSYRVRALLGRGGMGAVYKAEHKMMERCVALKTIGRDLDARPELVERFRREVKAAARLSHPNIVAAYDAEQAGRTHFLVMEYFEGIDLARLVAQRGKLPIEEACEYVCQATLGLQHAHEKGMIHRDIKPHNLMVTPAGQVKILDFGLALFAREADGQSGALTALGAVMGTADYMAPEQASDSHHADIRADIYSLGCTLYHLLAGSVPFPNGTFLDKVVRHATQKPTPISQLRPELPSGLVRVVERMMAKLPEQRYQTPAEVAQALAPFTKGHTPTSVAPDPFAALAPSQTEIVSLPQPIGRSHGVPGSAVHSLPQRRRSRFVALTLLVLLLGGVIAGAAAIYRIQTDNGVLIISTDNPDVEVIIRDKGNRVRIVDTKTNKEIKLDSGLYELELKGHPEGLKLSMDKVTIRRGETEIAKVERRPEKVAVRPRKVEEEKVGEVRRFEGHEAYVQAVAFSPNGRLAVSGTGSGPGTNEFIIRLWDLATGKEMRRLEGHTGDVYGAVFSPDGKRILSCGQHRDKSVRLWDVETGTELKRLERHTETGVLAVVCSPDGKRALSCGWDKTVRLWDLESGEQLKSLEGHTDAVRRVAFSPDGRQALSGSFDRTIRLWDLEKGEVLKTLEGHTEKVHGVAFLPDGRRAVSCAFDGTIRLWDLESGEQLKEIKGPQEMHALALSSDGRRLLTAAKDQTLRLWDVETGKELHCFFGHTSHVNAAAFSPDGRFALSGSDDRTMRLWRLPDPPPMK
jgi:WD40 repeat protein/serine/threonine protein kinase